MLKLIRVSSLAVLFMVFPGTDKVDEQIVHYESTAPLPTTFKVSASTAVTSNGIVHVD